MGECGGVADSLLVGTKLGVDCNGEDVGAGEALATCANLQAAKEEIQSDIPDGQSILTEAKEYTDEKIQEVESSIEEVESSIEEVANDVDEIDTRVAQLESSAQNSRYVERLTMGTNGTTLYYSDGTSETVPLADTASALAAINSPLATDTEVQQAIADALANNTGGTTSDGAVVALQDQINDNQNDIEALEALQDQMNQQLAAINTDQATLALVPSSNPTALRLTNEDGSRSDVPLSQIAALVAQDIPLGNGLVVNSNGEIEMQLSDDAGQLLEMRDDGAYYGIEAEEDVRRIYVKSDTGNDSNAGTQASPIKTLEEAFRRTPPDKNNTIFLYQGLDYIFDKSQTVSNGATRAIAVWGSPYSPDGSVFQAIRGTNQTYYWYATQELLRPRILMNWDTFEVGGNLSQNVSQFALRSNSTVTIQGVEIVFSPPRTGVPLFGFQALSMVYGQGSLNLQGVEIIDQANNQRSIYNASTNDDMRINLTATQYSSPINLGRHPINIISGSLAVAVRDDVIPADPALMTQYGFTQFFGNMETRLPQTDFIIGISRDPSGTPLNLTSNIVI